MNEKGKVPQRPNTPNNRTQLITKKEQHISNKVPADNVAVEKYDTVEHNSNRLEIQPTDDPT